MTVNAPMIQGIQSPNVDVNPPAFYANTRRMRYAMRGLVNISGLGTTDSVQLLQTGIVSGLELRVTGSITFGGTIGTTTMSYEWPLNIAQEVRLSANGQSNLVRCRGLTLRATEMVTNPELTDAGVSRLFGAAAATTTGTLALPCDNWGTSGANLLGPGTSVTVIGTYLVDLTFYIPVAADPVSLIGSVYAQSSATNLTLEIQWATQAQILAALGGAATFASALQWGVTGVVFSIPNVGGKFTVPDLSMFHQLAETRFPGLGQGVNTTNLPGVGAGRRWLRSIFNVYSGAAPAPLVMNDANFSQLAWVYGGADIPEQYSSGISLRANNVRLCGVDLGANWGLAVWDFANQFALRDTVDQGSTANLRLNIGLVNAPTSGYAQVAQDTLFAGSVGA